jgi:hypothetical protein
LEVTPGVGREIVAVSRVIEGGLVELSEGDGARDGDPPFQDREEGGIMRCVEVAQVQGSASVASEAGRLAVERRLAADDGDEDLA